MRDKLSVYRLDYDTLPFSKPHSSIYVMVVNTAQKHDKKYGRVPRVCIYAENKLRKSVRQKIARMQADRFPKRTLQYIGKGKKGRRKERRRPLYLHRLCKD